MMKLCLFRHSQKFLSKKARVIPPRAFFFLHTTNYGIPKSFLTSSLSPSFIFVRSLRTIWRTPPLLR